MSFEIEFIPKWDLYSARMAFEILFYVLMNRGLKTENSPLSDQQRRWSY